MIVEKEMFKNQNHGFFEGRYDLLANEFRKANQDIGNYSIIYNPKEKKYTITTIGFYPLGVINPGEAAKSGYGELYTIEYGSGEFHTSTSELLCLNGKKINLRFN